MTHSTQDAPQNDSVSSLFSGWDVPVVGEGVEPEGHILLGELLLFYFEWMSSNMVTDKCAKGVHALLTLLMPAGPVDGWDWSNTKKLLDNVYKNNVRIIDLCPNDCIAYVDCKHPTMSHYQHSHRTFCPDHNCGLDRFMTIKGKKVACKVGYYFPLDGFLPSIFNSEELKEFVDNDMGEFPPGHHRHSRGWHEKVTNNPHINCESRNQTLIGMADGTQHSTICASSAHNVHSQHSTICTFSTQDVHIQHKTCLLFVYVSHNLQINRISINNIHFHPHYVYHL